MEVVLTGFFVCLKEQNVLTKICTKCGIEKDTDQYFKKKAGRYGVAAECKCCCNRSASMYREANKKVIAQQKKAYKQANKETFAEYDKAYYQANKETIQEKHRTYKQANKKAIAEQRKAYRQVNKETIADQNKAYRQANREAAATYRKANKEAAAEYNSAYTKANRHLFNAKNAKRKATKLQATPAWADLEAIKGIYLLASLNREGGHDLHVDHIVPLQSDIVCGLHCEANLQLMPAKDNISKGNRRWPAMP